MRTPIAVALLAVSALAPSLWAEGSAAGPPALEDQFGKADSLAAHRGRPVVVLVVDGDRLRQIKGFEVDLRERFDGLDYIRVVQIPQQPGVRPEGVAKKLREKVPQDVSVLIDSDNVWSSVYGLDTRETSVLLFDRESRLVARFEGKRDGALVGRIAAEIESGLGVPRKAAGAAK